MSIEQRRFIRFSLDIPAIRYSENGEKIPTVLYQISLGGCLTAPDENIFTGEEFRLEINLPNGNRVPFHCRALYKFTNRGIGVRFLDITEFEQELLAEIISESLEKEGLPLQVDPFAHPPTFVERGVSETKREISEEEKLLNPRLREEEIVEEILSADH